MSSAVLWLRAHARGARDAEALSKVESSRRGWTTKAPFRRSRLASDYPMSLEVVSTQLKFVTFVEKANTLEVVTKTAKDFVYMPSMYYLKSTAPFFCFFQRVCIGTYGSWVTFPFCSSPKSLF